MDTAEAPRASTTRIAVDLLGGDGAPACVADAVVEYLRTPESSGVRLVVVGPVDVARTLLLERGVDPAAVDYAAADAAADMAHDALPAIRRESGLTASVAAGLVASGEVDGWVSAGHSGAAVAASALTVGRLTGMQLPALAVVLPALHGPVVLADAGATSDVSAEHLLAFARAGAAYARCLGLTPRVGLLTIGSEDGKGDRLRKSAHELFATVLTDEAIAYAGPIEGHDVASGARANVVVTDGFTGNVVLKAIEGAVSWSAVRMGEAYGDPRPAGEVVRSVVTSDFAGGLVLGIDGIAVVGHGAGTAHEIAACIRLASRAATLGVVSAVARAVAAEAQVGA